MVKPRIVDRVHYVSAGHSLGTYSSTCRAAIVTDVKEDNVLSLAVFSARGILFHEEIAHDDGKAGGTWHWPEQEDGPTSSILPANFKTPKAKG